MSLVPTPNKRIPEIVCKLLTLEELRDWPVKEVGKCFYCSECEKEPVQAEITEHYLPSRIVHLNCKSPGCEGITWDVCLNCTKHLSKGYANKHVKTRLHKQTCGDEIEKAYKIRKTGDDTVEETVEENLEENKEETLDVMDMEDIGSDFDHTMGEDSDSQHTVPVVKLDWFSEAFRNVEEATSKDIRQTFARWENMQLFWQAEHERKGAGIQYLVSRAFQQQSFWGENRQQFANLDEAQWHIINFIHYLSLDAKQKKGMNWSCNQSELTRHFSKTRNFQNGVRLI